MVSERTSARVSVKRTSCEGHRGWKKEEKKERKGDRALAGWGIIRARARSRALGVP